MRKGQVELIAILGIVIVAVVAVYFSWQAFAPTTVPSALVGEQKLVSDSVDSYITSTAQGVLRDISLHGGYTSEADYTLGSVEFLGYSTPYWQSGGQLSVPNLQTNFFQALNTRLQENRAELEASLQDEYGEVTLGDFSAIGQMLNNQITLNVNIPITFKGAALPASHSVVIQSKIGEVYEAATKLASYLRNERTLEIVTLDSMMQSPLQGDGPSVPFDLTFFTDCGDYYFKDWRDVRPWVEYSIDVGLGHLYMPDKMPLNVEQEVSYPSWSLPAMDGKKYPDLEVSFHLPDEFELDYSSLQFTPNPITVLPEPIPMSAMCWSEAVYVKYFLDYPAIVVIKDPLTGNLFRFANEVYIKNNFPGEWADTAGYLADDLQFICETLECSSSITVTNSDGSPIPGADISFMGCPVGETDSEGLFDGLVPCGAGALDIRSGSRYGTYSESYSTYNEVGVNELLDVSAVLPRIPIVNVHFYRVNMVNETPYWKITEIEPISAEEYSARVIFTDMLNTRYGIPFTGGVTTLNYLEPQDYYVTGSLIDRDYTLVEGGFGIPYTLREDTRDLYVYIPDTYGYSQLNNNETLLADLMMSLALSGCDIGPVSETEYTGPANLRWSEGTGCLGGEQ